MKMLVTSIFSFPTMFSKVFFFRVVKSQNCLVKSKSVYLVCLRRKKGILCGFQVKCTAHDLQNPGFFMGVSFGKSLQSHCLVRVKPRKHEYVRCYHYISEILLKKA